MAVQVVGGHVQRHSDVGMESPDGFELKAGEFEDVPVLIAGRVDKGPERGTDISTDLARDAALVEQVAGQGSRGCLAVCASDTKDAAFEEPTGNFDIAEDGDAAMTRLFEDGQVGRNSWRDDDEILALEGLRRLFDQRHGERRQLIGGLFVAGDDIGAMGLQELGDGDARLRHTNHQDLRADNLHGVISASEW